VATATVVLIYVAVWAAIGFALDNLMSQVMMPSSLLVVGIAVAIALMYAVTPWGRWAREQCRQMSMREPRPAVPERLGRGRELRGMLRCLQRRRDAGGDRARYVEPAGDSRGRGGDARVQGHPMARPGSFT
jgi:hypothetical protein